MTLEGNFFDFINFNVASISKTNAIRTKKALRYIDGIIIEFN